MRVSVLDTPLLETINEHSVKAGLNRTLTDEFFEDIHPDGKHLVVFSMVHNDDHIRTLLMAKMATQTEPENVYLDMSYEDYETIPEIEVEVDGE